MTHLKNLLRLTLTGLILFGLIIQTAQASRVKPAEVKLYALNCGTIDLSDGSSFSDTGFYSHKPIELADPCFLIKHNQTWILWDLGLGDKYVNHPVTFATPTMTATFTVTQSLVSQLKEIGLTPDDITYVAISHAHLDHVGNIGLFPHTTVLMQAKEYAFTQEAPLPQSVEASLFLTLKPMHKILLDGDHDVFGDGSVVILHTPGHTPGHQSLEIKLPRTGVVILSGDLYHLRRSYEFKQIPSFNDSRADTLASMARIDGILKNTHGRLIIQHDPEDFVALPKFPKYLN